MRILRLSAGILMGLNFSISAMAAPKVKVASPATAPVAAAVQAAPTATAASILENCVYKRATSFAHDCLEEYNLQSLHKADAPDHFALLSKICEFGTEEDMVPCYQLGLEYLRNWDTKSRSDADRKSAQFEAGLIQAAASAPTRSKTTFCSRYDSGGTSLRKDYPLYFSDEAEKQCAVNSKTGEGYCSPAQTFTCKKAALSSCDYPKKEVDINQCDLSTYHYQVQIRALALSETYKAQEKIHQQEITNAVQKAIHSTN
jgi:hypothetical protein